MCPGEFWVLGQERSLRSQQGAPWDLGMRALPLQGSDGGHSHNESGHQRTQCQADDQTDRDHDGRLENSLSDSDLVTHNRADCLGLRTHVLHSSVYAHSSTEPTAWQPGHATSRTYDRSYRSGLPIPTPPHALDLAAERRIAQGRYGHCRRTTSVASSRAFRLPTDAKAARSIAGERFLAWHGPFV